MTSTELKAAPLSIQDYKKYGDIIEIEDSSSEIVYANQGTASRRNFLANFQNLRTNAKMNWCAFRCKPASLPFNIKLLERHPYSTQVFIPMTAERYLVIVALGGDSPDISTLRVFVAKNNQAISYHPGVWHHPMVTLDKVTDFTCVVAEDGTAGDCEILPLSLPIQCNVLV